MTYPTTSSILIGIKCCALWLTIIGILLIIITVLLAILTYKAIKTYTEVRYAEDRINAIYEMIKYGNASRTLDEIEDELSAIREELTSAKGGE